MNFLKGKRKSAENIEDLISFITKDFLASLCRDFNKITSIKIHFFTTKEFSEDTGNDELIMFLKGAFNELSVKEQAKVFENTLKSGDKASALPLFLKNVLLGFWVINIPSEVPECEEKLLNTVTYVRGVNRLIVKNLENTFFVYEANKKLATTINKFELTSEALELFINTTDAYIYVVDFFTCKIIMMNSQMATFLGGNEKDMIDRRCEEVLKAKHRNFCETCPREKLLDESGGFREPSVREIYFEQSGKWMKETCQAFHWVDGSLSIMTTMVDITSSKNIQQSLRELAYYDQATQLPNAVKLERDIGKLQGGHSKSSFIISLDIRSLRKINDIYSRKVGDLLIKSIKDWLLSIRLKYYRLYRVDGDCFSLVMKNAGGKDALKIAERIKARFDSPWNLMLENEQVRVFCSVTIAVLCLAMVKDEPDAIVNIIERTLESAKRSPKIAIYDLHTDITYRRRLALELSLRSCVRDNMKGFDVHYQPIANTKTGRWCAAEALCRWTSPDLGIIPPNEFIYIAEQIGLINTIGKWVLDRAVLQCKQWGLDENEDFLLNINMSPNQLLDDFLFENIMEILGKYNYPPRRLTLEITESTQLNFTNFTMDAIKRIRDAGIVVTLDDFGTGYSSFNNLKNMPVSILKTEKAFIDNIENDTYLQYLFYVMVELAHAADMRLVAEGIETKEQLNIVLDNGADLLQGFLFSKPLASCDFEKELPRFYIDNSVIKGSGRSINFSKILASEEFYSLTPFLFNAYNGVVGRLLCPGSKAKAIYDSLSIFCDSIGIEHIYIAAEKGDKYNIIYSFSKTGWEDYIDWSGCLAENGYLITDDTDLLPQKEKELCQKSGIKSAAVIPVLNENQIIGYAAACSCSLHKWEPDEIVFAHNILNVMKTFFDMS